MQALKEGPPLWKPLTGQLRELAGPDPETFFFIRTHYGRAPEKAKSLAAQYRREIQTIREALTRMKFEETLSYDEYCSYRRIPR